MREEHNSFDYKKKINELKEFAKDDSQENLLPILQDAISLLEKIEDERSSLWELIEEMKKSDLQNYAEFLMEETQAKIASVKASISRSKRWKDEKN